MDGPSNRLGSDIIRWTLKKKKNFMHNWKNACKSYMKDGIVKGFLKVCTQEWHDRLVVQ
jgi:hypothetical protein